MKRITAGILVAAMLFVSLCGFTTYPGIGTAFFDSKQDIFEDAVYHEIIGNSMNGVQRAYYVEADIEGTDLQPLIYTGYVNGGLYTVGEMVKAAENDGWTVLAAINADIYDMSSGTPKGFTMHGGNIVTSGYEADRVIAFDKDGKGSLHKVDLRYSLSGTVEYKTTEAAINPEDGTEIVIEHSEDREWNNQKIDFFNVPHGGANGLHLYNGHWNTSTKTTGSNCEVVIEASDIQLGVNKTIKGKVISVNPDTKNTPIGSNHLVLSTVYGSATYSTLCSLKVGSDITISVTETSDDGLAKAKEAFGIYYSLVEDGKNVTNGTGLNPRTVLGFKQNGDIMIFEVDGRQSNYSNGVGLSALADALIELGCVTAVNLDGGGSSVVYVREAGKDKSATIQSQPSGGSERKVANVFMIAYKNSTSGHGSSTPAQLNVYPALTVCMPGATAQLKTYASNALYEKVSFSGSTTYQVTTGRDTGTVSDSGVFTAGTKTGTAVIKAKSGNLTGTTEILVTEDFSMGTNVNKINIKPGDTKDINVTCVLGSTSKIPVNARDDLFKWTCDPEIGTIDNNGVFKATEGNLSGLTGNITVSYEGNPSTVNGTHKITIPVTIGADIMVFDDTKDHWAKTQIGTLASLGILNGMGDNLFGPDNTLTRAQFVKMLASLENADVSGVTSAGFSDVPEDAWYTPYVNWAAQNGVVNGLGDGTFGPDNSITREQMAVMICNYCGATKYMLPQTVTGVSFTDKDMISSWANAQVYTCAGAGLINGFDTGDFQPQGRATRAQAATILYKLADQKGII